MRILVLAFAYPPDGGPGAPLYKMLCENLVKLGHDVTIITPFPHYPSGRVLAEYRRGWIQRSKETGVNVIRVRVPSLNRARLPYRMLQFLAYQFGAVWAGVRQSYDVLFIGGHALNQTLTVAFLSKLRRKPLVFSIYDVYPQVGVELGIFRNPVVVRAVGALQRWILNSADYVRVISEAFVPSLIEFGIPEKKIKLVYLWVDTEEIYPLPRQNSFSAEHGLDEKFVVLYAGNIGLSQGLENVLKVAQRLSSHKHIRFVFVGEGAGRERLVAQAETMKLQNVMFIPFQPRARVSEVLATANVSLISLQPGMGGESLPSKAFSILASGRPILAAIDTNSPICGLVERSQAGICVPSGDENRLVEAILSLEATPERLNTMGQSGRAYAELYHSPLQGARNIERLLLEAISSRTES